MSEAPVLPTATYAVTGATGHLGRLAVDALLRHGVPARNVFALVRDTAKADELAALGVGVREADYDRPETLDAALEGDRAPAAGLQPHDRRAPHAARQRHPRRGRRRRRLRRLHERAPRRRDRARAGARARRHRGPPPGVRPAVRGRPQRLVRRELHRPARRVPRARRDRRRRGRRTRLGRHARRLRRGRGLAAHRRHHRPAGLLGARRAGVLHERPRRGDHRDHRHEGRLPRRVGRGVHRHPAQRGHGRGHGRAS